MNFSLATQKIWLVSEISEKWNKIRSFVRSKFWLNYEKVSKVYFLYQIEISAKMVYKIRKFLQYGVNFQKIA